MAEEDFSIKDLKQKEHEWGYFLILTNNSLSPQSYLEC